MRCILDEDEPVAFGDRRNRCQVARKTAVVNDDDCLRSLADCSSDVLGVEIEVDFACDVTEDRGRAGVFDRIRSGDEVERGDDDLVSRTASRRKQGEVKRGRAVRNGEGVPSATELGELALERCNARPHTPPARRDCFADDSSHLVGDDDVGQRHTPCALDHMKTPCFLDLT